MRTSGRHTGRHWHFPKSRTNDYGNVTDQISKETGWDVSVAGGFRYLVRWQNVSLKSCSVLLEDCSNGNAAPSGPGSPSPVCVCTPVILWSSDVSCTSAGREEIRWRSTESPEAAFSSSCRARINSAVCGGSAGELWEAKSSSSGWVSSYDLFLAFFFSI